ncbi:MAG: helix-turn-helix domain-containing protein [Candidatus Marinimicrobia bacterium]|jgi:transcriptional regulator with XRE-family HTH domain|nr:helix-turn-helix domain-containing protein [Candidatus Neomarinimicrobiota bacterium]MBT3680970.1 helix-turn-helix domain-containing protein [Candidatus Neomarinimicrobiota bacterium]MBT3952103.1 helix-turn-helix domain-containing protein [Candidatus Neomarinimicrobiota bacterium]MBT4254301.1 helix-turn-helix domain-containing protein [Candidatus Neomarinimicrobiota bacterium]MBT4479482.1 helix-turn-helix domain-containing protein [Candidatus Neomarinimicrobiota bacterium]
MKIKNSTKTDPVLKEIGVRLTQQRVLAELTQAGLAEKAGVSKRTVERIEAGNSIQLSTMIQVLRVFKLLEPFGLALSAYKDETPAKKKSKPRKTGTTPPAEPSRKSHSWGY